MRGRSEKFEQKVGDSEDMYCGNSKCQDVRPHIWTVSHEEYGWGPTGGYFYNYCLRCKYCGADTLIYTTR